MNQLITQLRAFKILISETGSSQIVTIKYIEVIQNYLQIKKSSLVTK